MHIKICEYAFLPIFDNYFFNEENVQNSVHNVKKFGFLGFTSIFQRGVNVKRFALHFRRVSSWFIALQCIFHARQAAFQDKI